MSRPKPRFCLLAAAAAAAWQFATPALSAQVLPQPAVDTAAESAGSRHSRTGAGTRAADDPPRLQLRDAGLVTFADRPCGPAAQQRELKLAPAGAVRRRANPRASLNPTAAASEGAPRYGRKGGRRCGAGRG